MLEHPDRREALAAQIKELEHEGDQITHDTVHALHQTWITPLDREDIHALITALDDVLDFIEAAGERIALYEISEARPEAIELAKVAARVVPRRSRRRSSMLTEHQGRRSRCSSLCVEINTHENDADADLPARARAAVQRARTIRSTS